MLIPNKTSDLQFTMRGMYEALLPLFVHIINKYAHTRMNPSKFNTMQKVWK